MDIFLALMSVSEVLNGAFSMPQIRQHDHSRPLKFDRLVFNLETLVWPNDLLEK